MQATRATVVQVNEKGSHSILKVGVVVGETTTGVHVCDPRQEGELNGAKKSDSLRAEWFPLQSKRIYTRLEGIK